MTEEIKINEDINLLIDNIRNKNKVSFNFSIYIIENHLSKIIDSSIEYIATYINILIYEMSKIDEICYFIMWDIIEYIYINVDKKYNTNIAKSIIEETIKFYTIGELYSIAYEWYILTNDENYTTLYTVLQLIIVK